MTMHMVHPGLSTVNTGKSKNKKKLTAAQLRAKAEHEVWQRKNGVHPDQLNKKLNRPTTLTPYLTIDNSSSPVSNGFAPAGAKKSVFDSQWQRTYESDPMMAEREAIALKKADALKLQIAPAYSKGAYQLITKNADLTTLGKKV